MTVTNRNGKGCWYEFWEYFCPGCSDSKSYRERRYDERPDEYEKRHHYQEQWCGSCFT